MSDADRGQVTANAAEVYETFFVPALFGQWAPVVLDAGDVRTGHRVLDLGCGTGALARAAHSRVAPSGTVTAIDPNAGMLAVARRADAAIEWRIGVAEHLPLADDSTDRTLSQFALMFFTDPHAALSEMARVTRPDGRIALAVWDRLDSNVGYARLAVLIEQLFGPQAADELRAPFELGNPAMLMELATTGIHEPTIAKHTGVARFNSLEAWLSTEIRGWTLADKIDDDGFAQLLVRASDSLGDLDSPDGVAFEMSALVVSGPPSS